MKKLKNLSSIFVVLYSMIFIFIFGSFYSAGIISFALYLICTALILLNEILVLEFLSDIFTKIKKLEEEKK